MVVEIYPNIYMQEILLPKNPLRAINNYIIVSEDRNLIIDSGFNNEDCLKAFMEGVNELGLDLSKTDLLVTHLHPDHSGLTSFLHKEGVRIYAGRIDGKMINDMTGKEFWDKLEGFINIFDLKRDKVSFNDNPGYKYRPTEPIDFIPLDEGDSIIVGDYCFKTIDIPGHTPGHIGLYDKNHKIFFCGDHILHRITPNIGFWGFEQDILSVYFDSLKKVHNYDIKHLFSAHRSAVANHKERIHELLSHHKDRLNEVMEIIRHEKKSVRDTAANMHWELRYDKWEDFPSAQKWFASGEAMSHLEHLYCTGKAERTDENGILYYKLK